MSDRMMVIPPVSALTPPSPNDLGLLQAYIDHGRDPGDYLKKVLALDLLVMLNTRPDRFDYLHTLVRWVYEKVPHVATGSERAVRLWIETNGGRDDECDACDHHPTNPTTSP